MWRVIFLSSLKHYSLFYLYFYYYSLFSLLISLFSLLISIFFFPVLSQDPRQTHGSTTTPRPKPKPPSTQTPLENPNPENPSHQKIGEQGELRRREKIFGKMREKERKKTLYTSQNKLKYWLKDEQ